MKHRYNRDAYFWGLQNGGRVDALETAPVTDSAERACACNELQTGTSKAKFLHCGTAWALRVHCVHTAHAQAGTLTQEYLSPV